MIEQTSSDNHDLTRSPYYPRPIEDMDTRILSELGATNSWLEKLVNVNERARESRAQDVIDLSPNSGSQTLRTYTTKTGLRVTAILITNSAAAKERIQITVGARGFDFWESGYYPFPIEVTNGIDLAATNITTPASLTWSVYVFGYPF